MSTLEAFAPNPSPSPAEGAAVAPLSTASVSSAPLVTTEIVLSAISTDLAASSDAALRDTVLNDAVLKDTAPRDPMPSFASRVREFFYAPEIPYGIALTRMLICFTLLWVMVPRWYFARELFSTDGAPISLWESFRTHPWLPNPTGMIAVALCTIVVLTLITSCIGWCTRASLIVCTFSYLYLNMLDIIGTLNKYTVISGHLLFLLCFSQCGAVWSIDSWIRRSRLRRQGVGPETADQAPRYAAVSRRLIQLFIAAVYIGAATTKMKVPAYFNGEQLQTWMITEYNVPNPMGHLFALHPSLLVLFGNIGLMWEILFIFLCWRGIGRIAMLSLGFLFHFMTWLTLGLWVFPPVCYAAYLAFLNENDVAWFRGVFSRWRERGRGLRAAIGRLFRHRELGTLPAIKPAWSNGAFACLVLATAVGGVGLEYKLDPYGIRRPEGPYTLKEIDRSKFDEMTGQTPRLRNDDKVLLFDVGSIVVGGAVLDRRTTFRQGDTVRVQCALSPPHEDLWMECNLHDSEERVVDNIGIFVSTEENRPMFFYNLGDCTLPGDYQLVLKIAGEEMMRRPIKVLPRTTACLAN
jgi:Vitamin K-dependent gamma-carboxylase